MCEMQNAVKPKTKPSAKTGATFKVLATARSYFLLKHIGRFDNQQIHESFTKYAVELSCVALAAGV